MCIILFKNYKRVFKIPYQTDHKKHSSNKKKKNRKRMVEKKRKKKKKKKEKKRKTVALLGYVFANYSIADLLLRIETPNQ